MHELYSKIHYSCLSDSNKFQQYLEELCEGLPPKSCIVMDNASYHCKLVSLQCSKSKKSFGFGEIETFIKNMLKVRTKDSTNVDSSFQKC